MSYTNSKHAPIDAFQWIVTLSIATDCIDNASTEKERKKLSIYWSHLNHIVLDWPYMVLYTNCKNTPIDAYISGL